MYVLTKPNPRGLISYGRLVFSKTHSKNFIHPLKLRLICSPNLLTNSKSSLCYFSSSTPSLFMSLLKNSVMPFSVSSRPFQSHHTLLKSLGVLFVVRGVLLFVTILTTGSLIWVKWDFVKRYLGYQGADLVKQSLSSRELQESAITVFKALLEHILNDRQILISVLEWLNELLRLSEPEVILFFERLWRSEFVWNALRDSAEKLVEHLCNSNQVKEKVGLLLIQSLNTPFIKKMFSEWITDLLSRDDLMKQLEYIACDRLLKNARVQEQATKLGSDVVASILRDTQTLEMSKTHILEILNSESFQKMAATATWDVLKKAVMPRKGSSSSTSSFLVQQCDELSSYPPPTRSDDLSSSKPKKDKSL